MPTLVESDQEFIARHGGKLVRVSPYLILLPTGASVHESSMGTRCVEPPRDPKQLYQIKRQYWEALIQRGEKDFNQLRATLEGRTFFHFKWNDKLYGSLSRRDPELALNTIKAFVLECRNELAVAEQVYLADPAVQAELRRQEALRQMRAEEGARAQQQLDRIRGITLH